MQKNKHEALTVTRWSWFIPETVCLTTDSFKSISILDFKTFGAVEETICSLWNASKTSCADFRRHNCPLWFFQGSAVYFCNRIELFNFGHSREGDFFKIRWHGYVWMLFNPLIPYFEDSTCDLTRQLRRFDRVFIPNGIKSWKVFGTLWNSIKVGRLNRGGLNGEGGLIGLLWPILYLESMKLCFKQRFV